MCCNKNKIKKPLCLTNYAILLCFQNSKYWYTWTHACVHNCPPFYAPQNVMCVRHCVPPHVPTYINLIARY